MQAVSTVDKNSYSTTTILIVVIVVVLILLLIFGTCTETGKQQFENLKSKFSGPDLKSLDIVMFINPTCPHCIKMLEMLEREKQLGNVSIVDTTKEEGMKFAAQFGADKQPVPSFISRKLKTATVGSKDSLAALVKALTDKPVQAPVEKDQPVSTGNLDMEQLKKMQIILFAREGCPWCTKAKEACAQAGAIEFIKIIDITTPEGQKIAADLLPPGTSGVPAWVSLATKKSVIGFKPLDVIVKELAN